MCAVCVHVSMSLLFGPITIFLFVPLPESGVIACLGVPVRLVAIWCRQFVRCSATTATLEIDPECVFLFLFAQTLFDFYIQRSAGIST